MNRYPVWGPGTSQRSLSGPQLLMSSKAVGFLKNGKASPTLRNIIMTLAMNSWLVENLIEIFKENYSLNFLLHGK